MAAFLSVRKAIQFQEDHHWDDVRERCHLLVASAQKRICELTGLAPLHPRTDDWFCQMATALLPVNTDIIRLKNRLHDGYKIEIPLMDWNGNKLIRISVQGYNTKRDVDKLVDALSILLKE
jgi:isopenicillin-N epimerase